MTEQSRSAPPESRSPSPEEVARRIAGTALDKKAHDVVVLDMRGVVSYTDFFVICTGNTERQAKAIEGAIYQALKHDSGHATLLPARVEGEADARWILMDYLDCVVHIFTPPARDYYRLEKLWGEVPAVEVGEKRDAPSVRGAN